MDVISYFEKFIIIDIKQDYTKWRQDMFLVPGNAQAHGHSIVLFIDQRPQVEVLEYREDPK